MLERWLRQEEGGEGGRNKGIRQGKSWEKFQILREKYGGNVSPDFYLLQRGSHLLIVIKYLKEEIEFGWI